MIEQFYSSVVIKSPKNRFLAAHHFTKTEHPWRFVGGKIEPGEVPIAAAARELYEEINIRALTLRYVNKSTTHVDGGLWTGLFFLLEDSDLSTAVVCEPQKVNILEWFSIVELEQLALQGKLDMATEYAMALRALNM